MPVSSTYSDQWLRLGAATRLAQINAEVTEILKAFPEIRKALDGRHSAAGSIDAASASGPRRRRHMSAARKRAIREGTRKYWAKRKAGDSSSEQPTAKAAKPARKFSAQAKARLSRLAKERWAKAKKAGKTRLG